MVARQTANMARQPLSPMTDDFHPMSIEEITQALLWTLSIQVVRALRLALRGTE